MATEYFVNGEHVATRTYRGKANGTHLQLELTPTEYQNYKHLPAHASDGGPAKPLHQVVADHGENVHFDTPERRNEVAREMENSRHATLLAPEASRYRQLAKQAVKDRLKSIMSVN